MSNTKDESAAAKLALLAVLLPQIAQAIGPLYEVVLLERKGKQYRIKGIANNHISNRTVGGPMARIFYKSVEVRYPKEAVFNYPGTTEDGKRLRCSSIPIHHGEKIIGFLCINFLIHDLQSARDVLGALLTTESGSEDVSEIVPRGGDIFDRMVDKAIRELGRPAEALNRQEKITVLRNLKASGALNARGAINRIAAKLGVSRAAVYNYLREC